MGLVHKKGGTKSPYHVINCAFERTMKSGAAKAGYFEDPDTFFDLRPFDVFEDPDIFIDYLTI